MTTKQPLTLEINSGRRKNPPLKAQPARGAAPTPANGKTKPEGKQPLTMIAPKPAPQPAPKAVAPEPKVKDTPKPTRQDAVAQLTSVLAGLTGVDVPRRDIVDAMRRSLKDGAPAQQEAEVLARTLRQSGLEAQTLKDAKLEQVSAPALAFMSTGHVVLVLARAHGDVVVFDTTCPDNRAIVPEPEFTQYFSGLALHAEAPLQQVEKKHRLTHIREHWFWGKFQQYRRQLGEITLGSLVANMLAVSVALFSLQVYDRVIPHQSEATLWVLAIGAFLALSMESLIKVARARLMDGAGRQIELGVQQTLMQQVLGTRSDAPSSPPSMRFSQMRDFGTVREFFTASTIGSVADIPFIFVFLLLVASIAGPVVWVLIFGGILMVVPGFFLQQRMIQLTRETQGASARSARVLHEAIFELDTVKTQRAEDRVMRIWSELTTLSAVKSSDQRKLATVLTYWSQGIQQATYVSAVIAGTYLVFAGNLTVGSIIAVGILTSRTLAPLTALAGVMARWGNVKAALDGLDEIAQSPQDMEDDRAYLRREALDGGYELREVTFAYDAESAPVLDVPATRILPGQHVAVLGANGSGKSSLLRVLSGLYAPKTGRVLVDGTEIGQIDPRDLRRLVGYLGQEVRLFAGSLRDNLNLTLLERDDARLMEALDFAGLGAYVRNHAKGLDLEILDGGQGLSIGQRQCIGWARLWLQDPKICLLDEPTAALDQAAEAALVERLETWLKDRTAVIATHRVPILSLTERTMILSEGRLQVDGPRDKVLEHLAAAPKPTGKVVPLKGAVA